MLDSEEIKPTCTSIPELLDWIKALNPSNAFLVVSDPKNYKKFHIVAVNADGRFQKGLALSLMQYLETYFDATGDREALKANDRRKKPSRR